MIGSKLDVGIRKFNITEFKSLDNIPNILEYWQDGDKEFEKPDIAITCFLINGILKQIPYYITNDTSNTHIAKKNIVRVYRYDSDEKGKQLSMYFDALEGYKRGDLVIKLNNGKSIRLDPSKETFKEVDAFFECPYNIKPKVYCKQVFSKGFEIDNIDNKIVISPGFLFYKLFKKTLHVPIKMKNALLIRKKHTVVVKSIQNGDLLHIISKKTIFHKEINFKNKMVSNTVSPVACEIGENDEIFMEKRTTCYRDVNCQIYPYFPYLSHYAQIVISDKVKTTSILAFNDSFKGFLCIFGTSEGKNVGRSMALTKNTFVSTRDNLNEIYKMLDLQQGSDNFYVVVNSACIEVTKSCFENINLLHLKHHFHHIECFEKEQFKYITYKVGLLFKKLEDNLWVTAKDLHYWMQILYNFNHIDQLIDLKGYDFIIGYSPDIIKYYKHNAYPKNILTLNTLKNGILSTKPEYSLYFLETVSTYTQLTVKHKPVLEAENNLSKYYQMYLPMLNVMYASFKGSTQDDCIVVHKKVKVFDCNRLYTVKIKFQNETLKYYHRAEGPPNPAETKSFLGTIVCPTKEIVILSKSMYLVTNYIGTNIVEIYFTKPNFQVLESHISDSFLYISISSYHKFDFGDKLCNLHGQKGVALIFDSLPRSKYCDVDIIVNPCALTSRQTMGMPKESLDLGGKDYDCLINSDGKPISGTALIGKVRYFGINYLSSEHKYVAKVCMRDKITNHFIRGRARGGGMKIGNMEFYNCILGFGIAACGEEKFFEHSDRIIMNQIPTPKSVHVCIDEAACHKCKITYQTKKCIETVKRSDERPKFELKKNVKRKKIEEKKNVKRKKIEEKKNVKRKKIEDDEFKKNVKRKKLNN